MKIKLQVIPPLFTTVLMGCSMLSQNIGKNGSQSLKSKQSQIFQLEGVSPFKELEHPTTKGCEDSILINPSNQQLEDALTHTYLLSPCIKMGTLEKGYQGTNERKPSNKYNHALLDIFLGDVINYNEYWPEIKNLTQKVNKSLKSFEEFKTKNNIVNSHSFSSRFMIGYDNGDIELRFCRPDNKDESKRSYVKDVQGFYFIFSKDSHLWRKIAEDVNTKRRLVDFNEYMCFPICDSNDYHPIMYYKLPKISENLWARFHLGFEIFSLLNSTTSLMKQFLCGDPSYIERATAKYCKNATTENIDMLLQNRFQKRLIIKPLPHQNNTRAFSSVLYKGDQPVQRSASCIITHKDGPKGLPSGFIELSKLLPYHSTDSRRMIPTTINRSNWHWVPSGHKPSEIDLMTKDVNKLIKNYKGNSGRLPSHNKYNWRTVRKNFDRIWKINTQNPFVPIKLSISKYVLVPLREKIVNNPQSCFSSTDIQKFEEEFMLFNPPEQHRTNYIDRNIKELFKKNERLEKEGKCLLVFPVKVTELFPYGQTYFEQKFLYCEIPNYFSQKNQLAITMG